MSRKEITALCLFLPQPSLLSFHPVLIPMENSESISCSIKRNKGERKCGYTESQRKKEKIQRTFSKVPQFADPYALLTLPWMFWDPAHWDTDDCRKAEFYTSVKMFHEDPRELIPCLFQRRKASIKAS